MHPSMIKDHTNAKINKLLFIEPDHKDKSRTWLWKCLCDCGKITIQRPCDVYNGLVKSCGCHKQDIKRASWIGNSLARRYNYRECLFSDISDPETAYWVGYLLADGNIHKTRPIIQVCSKDREQIDSLVRWLDTKNNIFTYNDYYSVAIRHKPSVKVLAGYGVVPQKSHIAEAPAIFLDNPYFWRGMVDGDGWINAKAPHSIGLCGTQKIVNQFVTYIYKQLGIVGHIRPMRSIYQVSYGKSIYIPQIAKLLYSGTIFGMHRKYNLIKHYLG